MESHEAEEPLETSGKTVGHARFSRQLSNVRVSPFPPTKVTYFRVNGGFIFRFGRTVREKNGMSPVDR